jgi:hypothetical protein
MTAISAEEAGADPDWEYAPLRIPADVSRTSAAVRLSLHAEFGGWELARVQRYTDGSRQVLLRRKRAGGTGGAGGSGGTGGAAAAMPLPGLFR